MLIRNTVKQCTPRTLKTLSEFVKCSVFTCSRLQIKAFETMGSKTALVLLAEGAEEIEATVSIDLLRRAGISVTVSGIKNKELVKCSREVVIMPDTSLGESLKSGPYDVVVLPGGLKGAENIANSTDVKSLLTAQEKEGRHIAAICASPALALVAHEIGIGKKITCYPSLKEKIISTGKYTHVDERVVVDGTLITSQGPGTAFEFALAIVRELLGNEKAEATAKPLLMK